MSEAHGVIPIMGLINIVLISLGIAFIGSGIRKIMKIKEKEVGE